MHRLVVICFLLAGCAGPSSEPPLAASETEVDALGMRWTDMPFVEPRRTVEVHEDTFEVQEQGGFHDMGVPVDDSSAWHWYDLAPMLGRGPNLVYANLTHPTNALDLRIDGDDAAIWFENCECTSDIDSLHAIIVPKPGSEPRIGVRFVGMTLVQPLEDADGIDYELTITAFQDPARLPGGVPIAVDLPVDGSAVEFVSAGGALADIAVYGPDDNHFGIIGGFDRVTFEVDANRTAGEYVFYPLTPGDRFALRVGHPAGGVGEARILGQLLHLGDERTFTGIENQDAWSLEAPSTPLWVGFCFSEDQQSFDNAVFEPFIRVDAPGDWTIWTYSGGFTIGIDQRCYGAETADPRLVAGTYAFSYDDEAAFNIRLHDVLLAYER